MRLTSAPAHVSGLDHFLAATDNAYFLVHVACSFDPIEKERFVRATLAITLTRRDETVELPPLAWSMEPRCLPHITELSRSQKIDGSLKLLGVSVAREKRSQQTECLVQAFNELQANPRWDFRHADGAPIIGTQRLIMVVQTPAPTLGSVALTAELHRRRRPNRDERTITVDDTFHFG